MSDKCPFCGAGIRENLHTLKTFTCNTKYSLFSEEWVYWQSIECKDHQIANLQASLDEANRLLRYQEERNYSLNERLNEAEDRLEAWRNVSPYIDWKWLDDFAIIPVTHIDRLKALREL